MKLQQQELLDKLECFSRSCLRVSAGGIAGLVLIYSLILTEPGSEALKTVSSVGTRVAVAVENVLARPEQQRLDQQRHKMLINAMAQIAITPTGKVLIDSYLEKPVPFFWHQSETEYGHYNVVTDSITLRSNLTQDEITSVLAHELRHVWQARHGLSNIPYELRAHPVDSILWQRAIEADAFAIELQIGAEMRLAGLTDKVLMRALSNDGQMGYAFIRLAIKPENVHNGLAAKAAFDGFFQYPELYNYMDNFHNLIETRVYGENIPSLNQVGQLFLPAYQRLQTKHLASFGVMGNGVNYLDSFNIADRTYHDQHNQKHDTHLQDVTASWEYYTGLRRRLLETVGMTPSENRPPEPGVKPVKTPPSPAIS